MEGRRGRVWVRGGEEREGGGTWRGERERRGGGGELARVLGDTWNHHGVTNYLIFFQIS